MPATTPRLRKHQRFHSTFLPDDRDIVIFLPPGYEEARGRFDERGRLGLQQQRRYPVLYLHDGQNLFEPDTAFLKGQHWRAGETAIELIEAGRIEPLIMVGIYNTGAQRIHEYTHTHDRRRGGGKAYDYGAFLVEELKPFIDATYRTLPDAAHTGLGGSSLGALVTLYLGLQYPHVFSKLAVMSPSVWWDRRAILRDVRRATPKPPLRIWLDMGACESRGLGSARRVLDDARLLKAGLLKAGWVEGEDMQYEEVEDGTHCERAWGDRFGRVLEWLFPRQPLAGGVGGQLR